MECLGGRYTAVIVRGPAVFNRHTSCMYKRVTIGVEWIEREREREKKKVGG
jgi:hypothetical protein